jgi:hypothetical protein
MFGGYWLAILFRRGGMYSKPGIASGSRKKQYIVIS